MSRSYVSLLPSAHMAYSGTALLTFYIFNLTRSESRRKIRKQQSSIQAHLIGRMMAARRRENEFAAPRVCAAKNCLKYPRDFQFVKTIKCHWQMKMLQQSHVDWSSGNITHQHGQRKHPWNCNYLCWHADEKWNLSPRSNAESGRLRAQNSNVFGTRSTNGEEHKDMVGYQLNSKETVWESIRLRIGSKDWGHLRSNHLCQMEPMYITRDFLHLTWRIIITTAIIIIWPQRRRPWIQWKSFLCVKLVSRSLKCLQFLTTRLIRKLLPKTSMRQWVHVDGNL